MSSVEVSHGTYFRDTLHGFERHLVLYHCPFDHELVDRFQCFEPLSADCCADLVGAEPSFASDL
jgi:hypothetical protein